MRRVARLACWLPTRSRTPTSPTSSTGSSPSGARSHVRGIRDAAATGELAADVDADLVADLLAAPVFYRLFVSGDPVDDAFLDALVESVVRAAGG